MNRLPLSLALALVLLAAGSAAQAGVVVWVTENTDSSSPPSPDDSGWTDLLAAEGHAVSRVYARDLTPALIDQMNAADLVIVSRDTDSGNYTQGSEVADWNAITAPLMLQSQYLVRNNRWKWLNTDRNPGTGDGVLEVVDTTHPIFQGITLDPGDQLDLATSSTPLGGTTDVGNGQLLAVDPDNDNVAIAFWDTGTEFYSGSGQTAGGPRMFFGAGNDGNPKGGYNLTSAGQTVFLNSVNFLAPLDVYTWDGTANDWGTAHWLRPTPPPPPLYPDDAIAAEIPSGQVTVETNHGAHSVEMTGGTLIVGSGNTLSVVNDFAGAAGTVVLHAGSTLAVGGSGSVGTLRTGGDATVDLAGDLAVSGATFDAQNLSGTFTKTGGGTLRLDNTSGNGVVGTTNATFDVHAGTLVAQGAAPLGDATEVVLSGGRLTVVGNSVTDEADAIGAAYFKQDRGVGDLNFAQGSGAYAVDDSGVVNVAGPLGTASPDLTANQTGLLAYTRDGNPRGWDDLFAGFPSGDVNQFQVLWTGQFTPSVTGPHAFRTSGQTGSGGVDDDSSVFVDANHDGAYQPGEGVYTGGEGNVTLNLTAGVPYNFAVGFNEDGGNERFAFSFQEPIGGAFAGMTRVDPSAQPGFWSTGYVDAFSMAGTNVAVTADSQLEAITDRGSVPFGQLTLNNGTTLTTSGAAMTFGGAGVSGPAGRSATLANDNSVTFDAYADGGAATTFRKSGAGTLTVDNSAGGVQAAATTWEVADGTLRADGASPLGGSTALVLSGGTASLGDRIEPPAAIPASALHHWGMDGPSGTAVAVDSAGGKNGTLVGDATFVPDAGLVDGAILLDGGGDHVLVPGTPAPVDILNQSFSLAFYTKRDTGGSDYVIGMGDSGSARQSLHVGFRNTNTFTHAFWSDDLNWNNPEVVADTERWHHWVTTYNAATNRQEIWVDGQRVAGRNTSGAFQGSGSNDFWIGRRRDGNNFAGLVDEVYVYNRALTESEIQGTRVARTPADVSSVNVQVTADSTLESRSESRLEFSGVSLDNAILTTTGGPMRFGTASVAGTGGLNTTDDVAVGSYDDGGGAPRTFVKQGPGTLQMESVAAAGSTIFRVEGGSLNAGGAADPLGGAPELVLAGGTVHLTGPQATGAILPPAVGYWSFNDDTAQDASGNDNHGIPGGSLVFQDDTPVGIGSARSLRSQPGGGAANVLTVPTSESLEAINDAFTLGFWMKADLGDNGDWVRLFQHGTEDNPSRSWMVNRNGGNNDVNVRVDTMNGGNHNQNIAVGGPAVFDGDWHHLVFTVDSGAWRKYVDGIQVGAGGYNHGDGLTNTRDLYMFGKNGVGQYVGALDEVHLFDVALSGEAVQKLFTNTHIGPLVMTSTDVRATTDGSLSVVTDKHASFGNLFLHNSTATLQGAPEGFSFGSVIGGNGVVLSEPGNVLSVRDMLDPGGDPDDPGPGVNADFLVDGNLTLESGASYRWEPGTAALGDWPDSVDVAGDLSLSDWTLAVAAPDRDGLLWEPLPLLLGFDSVAWDPELVSFDLTEAPGWVGAVNPDVMEVRHLLDGPRGEGLYLFVPEPAGGLLLALGLLSMLLWRRRERR